jgi:TolB-like protein/Tfp pilus assembly protein PilF
MKAGNRMSLYSELKHRNVLRVAIAYLAVSWLLIQVIETLFPVFGYSDAAIRLVVILLAIGFPLVLILSWLYELTPEGLKLEKDVNRDVSMVRHTGQKLDRAIIIVLALALGYFAFDKFVLAPARDAELVQATTESVTQQASEARLSENVDYFIAVLPFANLGPDPESEYLAEAMTDELISRLAQIEGVRIKSRQSMARFKDTELDIQEIAALLGVTHVLEGGMRNEGNRIRVSSQLTDATSGFEEWSDVFDGESDDWFVLQADMAVRIADALDLHLSSNEAEQLRANHTDIQEAYDAYWRGWVLLEAFHADLSYPSEKLIAAEEHFQRALQLDPEYLHAIAGLSMANSYYYFYGVDSTPERRERAEELARYVLAADPDLSEAHVALGLAHSIGDNHVAAANEYRAALRFDDDNAIVWCLLAFSCNMQTPPDSKGAEMAALEAIRRDPTWSSSYDVLGWAYSLQGRYEEAAVAYQTGAELDPDNWDALFGLGESHLELGNYGDALSALEKARNLTETGGVLVYIGAAHAGLGNFDEAVAAVKLGLDRGFENYDALEGSPYFATLRDDPRFKALLAAQKTK